MHGFIQWPAHLMQTSRWNDVADEHGFIVVYPSGTGFPKRWNAHNWSRAIMPIDREVQFISDLIYYLGDQYNIDSTRIYTNGLSNGGGMAFVLACRLSERIAAIGSVSGAYLMPWDECQPTRPVPAIVFHGTADPIVPYQGDEATLLGSNFPAIPSWVLKWALHNSCKFAPVYLPTKGNVSGIKYVDGIEGAEVVFFTIHGGGHTWPGGKYIPELVAGPATKDIDATRVMWDFFYQRMLE
jgi:polyhydroxybutyrate depolymerase